MDRTLSHHSSQENGFGVFVPQRRPLYKEVVGYRIQDLPSERQRLDTANTLSVNYQDFLYSQNSKEESCYTQGNAGPRAVTQHLKTQTGGGGHTSVERGYSVHLLQNCVSCDKDWLGSCALPVITGRLGHAAQQPLFSHSDLPSSGPSVETVRVKEGNPVGVWSLPNIFKAKPG